MTSVHGTNMLQLRIPMAVLLFLSQSSGHALSAVPALAGPSTRGEFTSLAMAENPTAADAEASELEIQQLVDELGREETAEVARSIAGEKHFKSRGDVVPADSKSSDNPFPVDGVVARQVKFWELIFQTYPSTTILVHDVDEPDRIIDLIDFKDSAKGQASDPVRGRNERQRVAKRYVDRYELALRRFSAIGESALQFGAIERRIWSTYAEDEKNRRKLLSGKISIRSQSGLADQFAQAAVTAQRYLPYMEQVFRDAGLPVELTRLPFVESMFNVRARSKVGASGIWQFMPQTARLYMRVDGRIADERNSPWKATRAAARLMADNYQSLKSWPLAITAYNHGAAGMERAARETGSADLSVIIKAHSSPTFGFASRNFYAEFVAAVNSYDLLAKGKTLSKHRSSREFVEFTRLPRKASIAEIMRHSKVSRSTLAQLNPCLLPAAFKKYRYRNLPAGYRLRLPPGNAKKLQYSMSKRKNRKTTISRR